MTKKVHLRRLALLLSFVLSVSFFFSQTNTALAAENSKEITASDEAATVSQRAYYYQYSGYVGPLHRDTFYVGQDVRPATVVYGGKTLNGGSCTAVIRFDYKTSFTVNLNSQAGKFYINIPKGTHTIEVIPTETAIFTISIS